MRHVVKRAVCRSASAQAAGSSGSRSCSGSSSATPSVTVRIGGSRAQRDLIENTLIAAHLKTGRAADARALVERHADRRPAVPVAGLV